MKSKITIITVLMLVLGIFTLSGGAQVKNPDTFNFLWTSDIRTLDPASVTSTPGSYPAYNCYERLVNFDGAKTSEFVPQLATKVPSLENGLIQENEDGSVTYIFPIREGVNFHKVGVKKDDGSVGWEKYDELSENEKANIAAGYGELTPEDVKYSLLRAMLQGNSHMSNALTAAFTGNKYSNVEEMATGMAGVEEFSEVDESTLIEVFNTLSNQIEIDSGEVHITISEPFPATVGLMALPFGQSILDKEWSINNGAWPGTAESWIDYHKVTLEEDPLFQKENGTGPFQVEKWDRAEKEIVFEKFEGYWREPASLEKVRIRSVTEWSTRLLKLKAGDADYIATPVEFLDEVSDLEGVKIERGLGMVCTTNMFFAWPVVEKGNPAIGSGKLDGNGIPPDFFSNQDVRKAFSYSMNYDALLNQVLLDQTQQAHGPMVEGIMGWREDQPVYSYNPEKAEEYFKKAYGGELWEKGFELTSYYITGLTNWQSSLRILQQSLARINPKFELKIQGLQWSKFSDYLWGREDPVMPLSVCNWGPDYSDPGGPLGAATYYLSSDGLIASFSGEGYQSLMEKEFDPLLEKAFSLTDPQEREEIYAQLQSMSLEKATTLFMYEDFAYAVTRDWVHGHVHNPMTYGAWYFYPISKGESS